MFQPYFKLWIFSIYGKKGFIINIHKAGVKSEPNNYRGITLSSCLRKLFSLIINNRLVEYLNIKNIYSEYQFGVRKEHHTTDSIYIIHQLMSHYRRCKKKLSSFYRFPKSIW